MNTFLCLLYKVYMRLANIIRQVYVAKQIDNFTPPEYLERFISMPKM